MTKGKKWTLRLLGVAALALLICLCLMGNTMARYTSQGTGNGTLTVAVWDLETEEITISGESISPSDLAYDDDSLQSSARTNTSSWMTAFKMVNNSAVDADVVVALDETAGVGFEWYVDSTYSGDDSSERIKNGGFTWGTGWATDNGTNKYGANLMNAFGTSGDFNSTGKYGQEAFEQVVNDAGVFSIKLAYEVTFEQGTTPELDTDYDYTITDQTGAVTTYLKAVGSDPVTLAADGGAEDFYAEVVWTSIYGTGTVPTALNAGDDDDPYAWTTWAQYSDAVDTILGMYAESISFGVTWEAVQASVLP